MGAAIWLTNGVALLSGAWGVLLGLTRRRNAMLVAVHEDHRMTDALHEQHAVGVFKTTLLKADLSDFEQRMTIKGAAGLVLLSGLLAGLKFSGDGPVSDDPRPAWAQTMRAELLQAIRNLQCEMMARFDKVDAHITFLEGRPVK